MRHISERTRPRYHTTRQGRVHVHPASRLCEEAPRTPCSPHQPPMLTPTPTGDATVDATAAAAAAAAATLVRCGCSIGVGGVGGGERSEEKSRH